MAFSLIPMAISILQALGEPEESGENISEKQLEGYAKCLMSNIMSESASDDRYSCDKEKPTGKINWCMSGETESALRCRAPMVPSSSATSKMTTKDPCKLMGTSDSYCHSSDAFTVPASNMTSRDSFSTEYTSYSNGTTQLGSLLTSFDAYSNQGINRSTTDDTMSSVISSYNSRAKYGLRPAPTPSVVDGSRVNSFRSLSSSNTTSESCDETRNSFVSVSQRTKSANSFSFMTFNNSSDPIDMILEEDSKTQPSYGLDMHQLQVLEPCENQTSRNSSSGVTTPDCLPTAQSKSSTKSFISPAKQNFKCSKDTDVYRQSPICCERKDVVIRSPYDYDSADCKQVSSREKCHTAAHTEFADLPVMLILQLLKDIGTPEESDEEDENDDNDTDDDNDGDDHYDDVKKPYYSELQVKNFIKNTKNHVTNGDFKLTTNNNKLKI